jgi:hypothetical protein
VDHGIHESIIIRVKLTTISMNSLIFGKFFFMRKHFLIIALFLLSLSCIHKADEAKIMSKDDFVDILVDIHIFDAYSTEHSLSDYISDIDSLSLYSSIFHKYHTNAASFQATMDFYSSQPEQLGKIYDEVFGKINRLNQELTDQLNLFSASDLVSLSNINKYFVVRGDTANYPKPFIIPIKEPGKILVTAQIRLLPDDKSEDPHIYAYFYKDEADSNPKDRLEFLDFLMRKSNFSRDYQFIYDLKDKDYKYMHIQIPAVKEQDSAYMKNMQISTLRVQYIPLKKKEEKVVPGSSHVAK